MKKFIALLLVIPSLALANDVRPDRELNVPIPAGSVVIIRSQLGSGTPGVRGLEQASHMGEGIYHAPQYLAHYPTAGVIWPRVIDVQCEVSKNAFVCDDYAWLPGVGRGEYLFIRPHVKAQVVEKVIEKIVEKVVLVPGPERIVLVEVPAKKKGE